MAQNMYQHEYKHIFWYVKSSKEMWSELSSYEAMKQASGPRKKETVLL